MMSFLLRLRRAATQLVSLINRSNVLLNVRKKALDVLEEVGRLGCKSVRIICVEAKS
jgi:hypothetical protein